jgi:prepilin-type N-terminal cleavage/methylation domain-containing protein
MGSKMRKMLNSQKGFTLVELMTVLIILGVIMGIGVPKYLRLQSQAEYDADVKTITNIAKAAEAYAAQKNKSGNISLSTDLIGNKIVDGTIALNRKKHASNTSSIRNEGGATKLSSYTTINFAIDAESGQVTNLSTIITAMIGTSLY